MTEERLGKWYVLLLLCQDLCACFSPRVSLFASWLLRVHFKPVFQHRGQLPTPHCNQCSPPGLLPRGLSRVSRLLPLQAWTFLTFPSLSPESAVPRTLHLGPLHTVFSLLPTVSCRQGPSMPCSRQCLSYCTDETHLLASTFAALIRPALTSSKTLFLIFISGMI